MALRVEISDGDKESAARLPRGTLPLLLPRGLTSSHQTKTSGQESDLFFVEVTALVMTTLEVRHSLRQTGKQQSLPCCH
jgi:hypothetical protein